MKRRLTLIFLSIICVLCLCIGLTACGGTGENSGSDSSELDYTLSDDGTCYIVTGIGSCTDIDITIPSTYNNLLITAIGDNAFKNCTSLTSVTIGSGVTSIGDGAFEYCTSLTSVAIPDSVTSIGDDAFFYCTSLTSIAIPDSVTYIGSAFYGCTSLTSITIPNKVTSIGYSAFYDCTALTEIYFDATAMNDLSSEYFTDVAVTYANVFCNAGIAGDGITVIIGANVTKIPAYLFYHHSYHNYDKAPNITNIVFEKDSVCESIGSFAFDGCSSLKSISIPSSVTAIGDGAFEYCTSLTNIVIPDSVTSIGGHTFKGCTSLESVNIPNAVTSIGVYAFYNCTSLTSITIPINITSIGNYAFYNCTALTEIIFNAAVIEDLSQSNYIFYCAGQDGKGIEVTIGSNVTKIPAYMFCPYYSLNDYAPKITSVIFEKDSVCASIGSYAFYVGSSLTNIKLGENVTTIGQGAFRSCSSLKSITIPNSVSFIGSWAFYGCSSLKNLTIGKNVASIGSKAFYGCTALTEINFNAINMNDLNSDDDVFFKAGQGNSGITVTIGEDVTKIPACLFYSYGSNYVLKITSVTIGENVTSIGNNAFYNCTALMKINFNATSMDDLSSNTHAFDKAGQNDEGITVTIGANVTKIPAYLFNSYYVSGGFDYSPKITSIVFEDGNVCESIGDCAFYKCTSLTNVYYSGTVDDWHSIMFSGSASDPTYYGATLYYYSENEPTDSGNYWHYVNSEIVVWVKTEE
ncbi:MAG: leucine-rich repeat domain-containing protein [Clostridia bacterium]|nr:leucine-rich repeat domain-containing protein [Clostridia bacterium]